MAQAAQHSILIVSDSDVRVTPEYLRAVVAPLADEKVGLVTCPYRGVPQSGAAGRQSTLCGAVGATGRRGHVDRNDGGRAGGQHA